jgi:hypothetical protein
VILRGQNVNIAFLVSLLVTLLGPMLLLTALVMVAAAVRVGWFGDDSAWIPPEEAIDGTLADGPVVDAPAGGPILFGRVRISAMRPVRGKAGTLLLDEDWGDPHVTLETASGPVPVELREPMKRWTGFDADRVTVTSLEGVPGGDVQAPADTQTFSLFTLGVRPGQALCVLVADGVATRVWNGSRADMDRKAVALAADRRAFGMKMGLAALVSGGIGLLLTLCAGVRLVSGV